MAGSVQTTEKEKPEFDDLQRAGPNCFVDEVVAFHVLPLSFDWMYIRETPFSACLIPVFQRLPLLVLYDTRNGA